MKRRKSRVAAAGGDTSVAAAAAAGLIPPLLGAPLRSFVRSRLARGGSRGSLPRSAARDKLENRHSGLISAKEVKRRVGCAPQGQDMRSQPFKVCFETERTVAHRRHGEEEEELLISRTISLLFCHRLLVASVALTDRVACVPCGTLVNCVYGYSELKRKWWHLQCRLTELSISRVTDIPLAVYAVSPKSTSLLSYTIQKLLASTSPHPYAWWIYAHRVILLRSQPPAASSLHTTKTVHIVASAYVPLLGVVSIVDILPFFAHLVRLDVGLARMQHHHRASCTSTNPVHQVASEQPQQRHEPDSEVAADSVI
ncbi:hypothetical protein DFH08DRAFT_826601 [Mycena albidolilacea]|uniref:Uncharacterized protein n=1 Tax=Mycena albidolilacea TaxID=1033008 RepID=A0AAD6Z0U0_9AGAR|nr:hypothetical protein DFH08DRAFT_826601 [Mycena albidolilacea]